MPEELKLQPTDRVYRDALGNLLVFRESGEHPEKSEIYFLYTELGCTIATKLHPWQANQGTIQEGRLEVTLGHFFKAFLSVSQASCAFVGEAGSVYKLVRLDDPSRSEILMMVSTEEELEAAAKKREASRRRDRKYHKQ
ncbi:MAG TPA: hypothetical protein VNG90_03560 [Candidatus Acidoferrum sp.]|nr:hypothetical protein [Candidatus Acidoferrum sp.]